MTKENNKIKIDEYIDKIGNILADDCIEINCPMEKYTTFKLGGNAAVCIKPDTEESLINCVELAKTMQIPFVIIGNGSNIIVKDGGYDGVVIVTLGALTGIEECVVDNSESSAIKCGAGEVLSKVARFVGNKGLSGMEFAGGIPGTIGGAVFMNAGAYGGEMSNVVENVRAYSLVDGNIIQLTCDDCEFAYRHSMFQNGQYIILGAEIKLEQKDSESEVLDLMADYAKRRADKQPLQLPSAGSFFKRPAGDYAGRLIEESGMKGYSVGGAQVSPKHAGFVVNNGGATATDLLKLSADVKQKVFEKFNIMLEEEPIFIGNDD